MAINDTSVAHMDELASTVESLQEDIHELKKKEKDNPFKGLFQNVGVKSGFNTLSHHHSI